METDYGNSEIKRSAALYCDRDCFANKDGVCVCLEDNDFHGKDCLFFKTTAQCDADRQKSYERLVSIGRDDLIERYQVRGVYGS